MQPSKYEALKPTQAEIPELVALMREFYAESGFPLPEEAAARTFAALIDDPRLGQIFLLRAGGQAAGFVVLTVCFSMEYGGLKGFVDDLFVAPGFRRRGLGGLALAAVLAECHERGVRALLVETGPENKAALATYKAAGFGENGRIFLSQSLAAPVHESD